MRVKGFVYREPGFAPSTVVIGRYAVTCCAADASVVGFLARFPDAAPIRVGTWLEVEGTLKATTIDGLPVPAIQVDRYEAVQPPKNPYVYANF